MHNFETGNRYLMVWPGDADAYTVCTVLKRTAKFVTLDIDGYGVKRCAIRLGSSLCGEYAMPLGTAFLAPILRASRLYNLDAIANRAWRA